jgi:hypothetical protein
MTSNLFVLYKPGDNFTSWNSPDLSKYNWEWIGAGSTGNKSFPREEQYSGPSKNTSKVEKILSKTHLKLLRENILDSFIVAPSVIPFMKDTITKGKSSRRKKTNRNSHNRRRKTTRKTTIKGDRRRKNSSRRKKTTKNSDNIKRKTSKAKHINTDDSLQTSGKYLKRNSPPYHASAYCSKNKKGNDGNIYFSKKMPNGSCRWIKKL